MFQVIDFSSFRIDNGGALCYNVGMRNNLIKHVAVALRLSFASHRDILHGISCYAKTHHWQLEFVSVPDSYAHAKLKIQKDSKVDGVISSEAQEEIVPAMCLAENIPIVSISPYMRLPRNTKHPLGLIRIEETGFGSCGAKYLLSLGKFRSFGFVPENHREPSDSLLLHGFRNHLKGTASPVEIYKPEPGCVAGSEQDIDALARWLSNLPTPAAVMAIYDLRATQVLTAAQKAGIAVPKQVSVIGVDNDELLCDFTTPTLTSIAVNFVHAGTQAAQLLDEMMRKGKHASSTVKVVDGNPRIVERESTAHLAPAVSLVEHAMSYIRKNALSGINVNDVVEHLGVSRRLADRRFREITKSSMMETIISIRLDAIKARLASTRLPIGAITGACGFRNENHAKNLFRKRFGMSMREWRKTHS